MSKKVEVVEENDIEDIDEHIKYTN